MRTKDDLLSFLIKGYVHLSKKDYGFFSNLQYLIKDNQKITSNQAKLFDKLILKYQRQLKKNNLNVDILTKLSWVVPVVETSPEYLEAKISIIGDMIQIKSPFNSKFIQHFRKIYPNPFVWNKDNKAYEAEYSTFALKTAVSNVGKYYDNVKYCETTNQLLKDLQYYDTATYWNPTLVKSGNNFYIAAVNESLLNSISNICLDDTPLTLFTLSKYGIDIDESIIQEDKFKKFASQYEVIVDLEDVSTLALWLKNLKVDQVYTARDVIYNKTISNEVKTALLNQNLNLKSYITDIDAGVNVLIKNTTYAYMEIKNIDKIIHLTNSRTINVK